MRILMINKFLRPVGGAETYVLQLGKYLEKQGHQVQYFGMEHPENVAGNRIGSYTRNVDFHNISFCEKMRWGSRVVYSVEARRKLRRVLEDFQPEVCHVNNFNYQLTPSILLEIRKWSRETGHFCRIVYTAHDYQLVCPNHMCYDGSKNCEKCLDGQFGNCVKGKCIHGSRLRSLLGALESALWHRTGIYRELDVILCCSEFLKEKLDRDPDLCGKTVVCRNFSFPEEKQQETGKYVLYFGRYSPEKGVGLLVRAAKELPEIPFVFAGAGELEPQLKQIPNIKNVGFQTGEALKKIIRDARFTVCPSVWYENCPFAVLESLDCGVPVLGADIGGIPELLRPGVTGNLFPPGDFGLLKHSICQMWENPIAHFHEEATVTLPAYANTLTGYYRPSELVTVVVPVYNTAAYLDRCVESILNQTHRNLHILLIDDGSTDESGRICDRWAEKDPRIRVIHQQNIGLGLTRNKGIAEARGEAICFVDSDDYILPRTIEKAMDQLRDKDAVVFGVRWESTEGTQRCNTISLSQYLYQGAQVCREFLPMLLRQEGNIPISSCAGLYRLAFIRKIHWKYPSERDMIAEDVYALLELYGRATQVAVLKEALYVYCQRADSLTHHYRIDRFRQLKGFYDSCLSLCRERGYPGQVEQGCASVFLDIVIGCLKQETAFGNWRRVKEILDDPVVQSALALAGEKQRGRKRILFAALRKKRLRLCFTLLAAQNLWEGVMML